MLNDLAGETASPNDTIQAGSLVVVGTGLRAAAHATLEAIDAIARAQEVAYVVPDPLSKYWIRAINPRARSLTRYYAPGKDRAISYREMTEDVVRSVVSGTDLCFAVYGHPGVYASPTHEAVKLVRAAGHRAVMLPGISAEDCLFADLGVDPANAGCQSFEATDFLVHDRRPDPCSALVLWQIGAIGQFSVETIATASNPEGISVLAAVLAEQYGSNHLVTVYEASNYTGLEPYIRVVPLRSLGDAHVTAASTLYVPPRERPRVNASMLARLKIEATFDLPPGTVPSLP